MKAWYFSNTKRKLRYGDGRLIEPGITHTVDVNPVLCESGLHGSKNILDALQYAPGPVVWRVNLTGKIVVGDDKMAATRRKYLWGYDATNELREFAQLCALDVIHLWDAQDVVVTYLKTGREDLRAAAWAAARDAERDAAWYAAAWDAARAAAAAARDAERDAAAWAAVVAARAAVVAAVGDAAGKRQARRLERLIIKGKRRRAA